MKDVWEIVVCYHGVIKHKIEFTNRRKLNLWLVEYLKTQERVWSYDLYLEQSKVKLIKQMTFEKFLTQYVRQCVFSIRINRQKIIFIKKKKVMKNA